SQLGLYLDLLAQSSYIDGDDHGNYGLAQYGIGHGSVLRDSQGSRVSLTVPAKLSTTLNDQDVRQSIFDLSATNVTRTDETLYFVFVQPGVTVVNKKGHRADDPKDGFAGYHSVARDSSGQPYYYAIINYADASDGFKGPRP